MNKLFYLLSTVVLAVSLFILGSQRFSTTQAADFGPRHGRPGKSTLF